MKSNVKQTSLTIALALALSMSIVPVAQSAPVTTPGGVVLDALIDNGDGYVSILNEQPFWFNAGAPITVAVDVTGGTEAINQVLFGLTDFDDPAVAEFVDVAIASGPVALGGAPPLAGWTGSVDDDDSDGHAETARWIVAPPENTCSLPVPTGANCDNTLITSGNQYRFEVTLTPSGVADRELQHWSITTSTPDAVFESTVTGDLVLFGFDDTLHTISPPVVTWSGGMATATFTVADPIEGAGGPRQSGISFITANEGDFNNDCDSSGGSLVTLNAADVTNFGYGPASLSCTLSNLDPASANSITLDAQDAAGNLVLLSFDLDVTAPLATLSFDDGAGSTDPALYHSEASPQVTFTYSDAESLIDTGSIVFIVGGVEQICGASPCVADLSGLGDGVHAITADVSDRAGNAADQQTMTVHIDRAGPTFTTTPSAAPNGAGWYNVPPTITATISDGSGDVAGVSDFNYQWSGATTVPKTAAGATSLDVTPIFGQGTSTLTLTGEDDAHTPTPAATVTHPINFDDEMPSIDTFALSGGTIGLNDIYTDVAGLVVNFAAIDPTTGAAASGIDTIELRLDGSEWVEAAGGTWNLGGAPGEGSHTVDIRVTDVAGNVAEDELTFDVDTVHPAISNAVLASDNGHATLAKDGHVLTLTFDVDDGGVPTAALAVDAVGVALDAPCSEPTPGSFSCDYTVQAADAGAVTFTIDAVDAAGNAADQVLGGGVTVDNTLPVATITGITGATGGNGALNDREDLTFAYTATDNIGVVAAEYSTDGGATWLPASGNSIDVSGLDDGSYTLDLRAFDGAGNEGVDSLAFDVDDTAPVIDAVTLLSDNDDATQATVGDKITLGFTLDDTSGPLAVSIDIAGVEQATEADCDATIECVYTVIASQNGPVTFDISATDAADNEATESGGGVNVDTLAPDAPTIALVGGTPGTNDWYTAVGDLSATITPGDETGTIEHQLAGGGWTPGASVDLSGLAEGTHTLQARVVDAAGNEGAIDTETIKVDTTAPVFDTPLALSGGQQGDGDIYIDTSDLVALFAASEAHSAPMVLEHSFDGITYAATDSPLDLSGVAQDGHNLFVRATNDAGLVTVESISFDVDTELPTLSDVSIASDGASVSEANDGDTITLSWTPSEALQNVVVTIEGVPATVLGDSASVTIDPSFSEGPVIFSIDYEDLAGTAGNPVTLTSAMSAVTINFGDLVATTTTVVDSFMEIGDQTTITATTLWDEDPAGALIAGDPYAFGTIGLFDASDLNTPLQTKTSNTAGVVNFVVTSATVAEKNYVVKATGYAPNPSRLVTETKAELDRSESVIWTQLIATAFTVDDALNQPGDTAEISVDIAWAHGTQDPAGGLSLAAVHVTTTGTGVAPANDPRDLVPDTAKSGFFGGLAEDAVGTYKAGLTHPAYESLKVNLAGGPIKEGTGVTETNFAVPSVSDVYVHFVGAYVDSITFDNLDDDQDPTDHFVNLHDEVEITANVVYTPNYDPSEANGVNTDGPAPVDGATVALFETSHLDATFVVTPTAATGNGDSTDTAATDAAGDAVFTVDKTTFTRELLRDGANTYGLQFFVTDFDSGHLQSVVQANADDLDEEADVTFTALDLSYVATSLTGQKDPVSGAAGGRWWFGMDNAKGDADTDPADTDAATLDLEVRWRHDGQLVEGASVKVDDAGSFLNDGIDDLTGTSIAGLVDLAIEPDDYGLDALIKQLEFIPVSAPEPGGLTGSIVESVDTFEQEFLWTRVAIFAGVDFSSDAEVDLGSTVGLYSIPVYYHDEIPDGEAYYFSNDYDFTDQVADLITDETYTGEMHDATNFGGLTAATYTSAVTQGFPISFDVFGGCTDLSSAGQCASTQEILQAGYHTYTAHMSIAPHDLPVDTSTVDILYTAVVIDSATNRLTAEVSTDIELTAHAFYAHLKDVDGNDLPDTGFGTGNLPYTNGVTADIRRDGLILAPGLQFTSGELEFTLAAESLPGDHDFLVDATVLAGQSNANPCPAATDCSEVPLTLVYDSASMNRIWLEATIRAADGRADFTDRNVQVAGRSVDVFFDVDVDDGTTTSEVEDTGNGYAFSATDSNPAARFSRTTSTTPSTTAPTMQIVAPDGTTTFGASYVNGEGGCTTGCWKATISGFGDVAPDQHFDTDISVPVTDDSAVDIGTTLVDLDLDAFEVDFTNIVLEILSVDNDDWQTDLSQFWNDLGDAATFQLKATWAHDDSAAKGATILVETPDAAGVPLPIAMATDADDDGTYDVSIPSPMASEQRTYVLDVASIPSPDGAEAALTESTVFVDDAGSLTAATAQPVLVHTRVLFDWIDAYDGGFANRGQSLLFEFQINWEHDDNVDVPSGWTLTAGGEEAATAVLPGQLLTTGVFEITQATSGAHTLVPALSENNVDAPRGIQTEFFPTNADTAEVTWTAIAPDIDDTIDDATRDIDVALPIGTQASLEHEAATFLADVELYVLRTLQTTTATGFPGGTPGVTVQVVVIQPGTIDFVAEGIAYTPAGTVLGGGTAITASNSDTETVTFADIP